MRDRSNTSLLAGTRVTRRRRTSFPSAYILIVALAPYAVSVTAQAECAKVAESVLNDTKLMSSKIVRHLGPIFKNDKSYQEFLLTTFPSNATLEAGEIDNHFHEIDTLNNSAFAPFNAIGVMTATPVGAERMLPNMPYGTAFAISACYVVTNRHVVAGLHERKNHHEAVENEEAFFSVGQTCGESRFSNADLKAKVVLFDHSLNGNSSPTGDWVVMKLEKSLSSDIVPLKLSKLGMVSNKLLIRAGFPWSYHKQDFDHVSAQYVKTTDVFNSGIVEHTDQRFLEVRGISGGPVLGISPTLDKRHIVIEVRGLTVEAGRFLIDTDIKDAIEKAGIDIDSCSN